MVGLAGLVGDVGCEHEVIEHGVACLGQHQGHVGRELSMLVSRRLAFGYHLVVRAVADVAHVPVARIAHPPEGVTAHHLIPDGGSLYGHAGIAAGCAAGYDGVAVLIVLRHAGDVDLEGGPLVFLYAEGLALLVIDYDGERPRQPRHGQDEVGGGRSELVGPDLLLADSLPVGIFEGERHLLVGTGLDADVLLPIAYHGHVYGLPRPIDGAVGEDAGLAVVALGVVVDERSPLVAGRAGLVAGGVGP